MIQVLSINGQQKTPIINTGSILTSFKGLKNWENCLSYHDIAEMLLKLALNTNQSITRTYGYLVVLVLVLVRVRLDEACLDDVNHEDETDLVDQI